MKQKAKRNATENYEEISLYNSDGSVRSKEDFLADLGKVYDTAVSVIEKEKETEKEEEEEGKNNTEEQELAELLKQNFSTADIFSDPESYIDAPAILDTFDFSLRTILI